MSAEQARKLIASIIPVNGYITNVTDIADQSTTEGLRPRGVALCQENGSVMVRINAETQTLEMLKQYIGEVLDEAFVIEPTDDAESLKATPKRGEVAEGDDDDAIA